MDYIFITLATVVCIYAFIINARIKDIRAMLRTNNENDFTVSRSAMIEVFRLIVALDDGKTLSEYDRSLVERCRDVIEREKSKRSVAIKINARAATDNVIRMIKSQHGE